MSTRKDILDLVPEAWRAFDCAPVLYRVDPSIPVLFFGDLEAYCESELRVVTVGLNPSAKEFPKYPDESPFCRFPSAEGITPDEHERYLNALSAYFRSIPYMGWFSAFESMLCGMGTSYHAGKPSTALHTDICSPVATDPTWSRLKRDYRDIQAHMKSKGVPLWHKLIKALKPNVVIMSIARKCLLDIEFKACGEWKVICEFDKKKNGGQRKQPYKVCARWYEVCSKPTLFVWGQAAQKPFASISFKQRCDAGKMALDEFRRGR